MIPYYERDGIVIYHGDCREILPQLEPVDLVLTDPPYGVGIEYGAGTDDNAPNYAEWCASWSVARGVAMKPEPTAREVVAAAMSEAVLERAVIDEAKRQGWMVSHSRPARKKDGTWMTPLQGHKGAPDLLLARNGVVLHVEDKSMKGKLSDEQEEWRLHLGASYRLWRPDAWIDGTIQKELM